MVVDVVVVVAAADGGGGGPNLDGSRVLCAVVEIGVVAAFTGAGVIGFCFSSTFVAGGGERGACVAGATAAAKTAGADAGAATFEGAPPPKGFIAILAMMATCGRVIGAGPVPPIMYNFFPVSHTVCPKRGI